MRKQSRRNRIKKCEWRCAFSIFFFFCLHFGKRKATQWYCCRCKLQANKMWTEREDCFRYQKNSFGLHNFRVFFRFSSLFTTFTRHMSFSIHFWFHCIPNFLSSILSIILQFILFYFIFSCNLNLLKAVSEVERMQFPKWAKIWFLIHYDAALGKEERKRERKKDVNINVQFFFFSYLKKTYGNKVDSLPSGYLSFLFFSSLFCCSFLLIRLLNVGFCSLSIRISEKKKYFFLFHFIGCHLLQHIFFSNLSLHWQQ